MEENNQKPRLRFKGFTEAWEQRKLGEIAKITMGQSPDGKTYSDKPTKYLLIQGNADLQNGKVVPRIWTTQLTKKADKNDIIFTVRAPVGEVAISQYSSVIGRGVASIKSTHFLYQYLKKLNGSNFWNKLSAGSTFDSINSEQLKNVDIYKPKDNEEKAKISNFLDNLDNLITLHQRKCDKLVNVKKALLEKMFPNNGKNVPELRFSGFTEAWEQRKLSEVAEIIGGGTPSTGVSEYWDGDIDWYAPAEINDQIYVECSERKITRLGLENSSAKILPANKTVLFTSRAGIGKTAILRREGATNQGFQSMVLNDQTNPYFVFSMNSIIKEKAERVASGSTFAEISGKMLGNLEFMFPSKAEQDKIGDYFENLDNLITLHQHKLEKLKNVKKSLLDKMFV